MRQPLEIALLVISNSHSDDLKQLVFQTLNSAMDSCLQASVNLSVYCSEGDAQAREQLTTYGFDIPVSVVPQDHPFNYNGELNRLAELAVTECNPDYLILANSDLFFHDDCIPKMAATMKENEIHSASPYDPWVHALQHKLLPNGSRWVGHEVRKHLTGWCIFISTQAYKAIGGLNEEVAFWYSDNIYADQLKKALIPHVLITDCVCEHVGSQTLATTDRKTKTNLTDGEYKKYVAARKSLGNLVVPVENFVVHQGNEEHWHSHNLTLIKLISESSLEKMRSDLLELLIRRFTHSDLFFLTSFVFYRSVSRRSWPKDIHESFWNRTYKRLGKDKKNLARAIRISLWFE